MVSAQLELTDTLVFNNVENLVGRRWSLCTTHKSQWNTGGCICLSTSSTFHYESCLWVHSSSLRNTCEQSSNTVVRSIFSEVSWFFRDVNSQDTVYPRGSTLTKPVVNKCNMLSTGCHFGEISLKRQKLLQSYVVEHEVTATSGLEWKALLACSIIW